MDQRQNAGARHVTMRRRELIILLGGAAIAWPLAASAQQKAMPVVGIFTATNLAEKSFVPAETDAFLQAMHDLGYVEGRTVSYAYSARNLAEPPDPYSRPALAQALIRQKPQVIVTAGGEPSVRPGQGPR